MSVADLHLCEKSSTSKSENSKCDCPPEYYCAEICPEGYSISTYISWQHFPRSTSTRSRCSDISETVRKSISDTPVPEKTPEKSESLELSSTQYPITKSFAQLDAEHYLEIRHVFDFLNFMMGHLLCNEPDDPVQFLEDLLEQCLKFRDSFGEPPLLFTTAHIKSLYNAFDPFKRNHMTLDQYKEAINSLGLRNGITQYNAEPPLNDEGNVENEFFMFEAERCLVENLKQMLRIPKLTEENRLKWQRKVKEFEESKKTGTTMKYLEENVSKTRFEKKTDRFCDCFGSKPNINLICKCIRPGSLQEQFHGYKVIRQGDRLMDRKVAKTFLQNSRLNIKSLKFSSNAAAL